MVFEAKMLALLEGGGLPLEAVTRDAPIKVGLPPEDLGHRIWEGNGSTGTCIIYQIQHPSILGQNMATGSPSEGYNMF